MGLDGDSYACFFPDKRFHSSPTELREILRFSMRGLNVQNIIEINEKIDIPEITGEEIIQRALAQCTHCKYHETEE